jgi:hypothetical protein
MALEFGGHHDALSASTTQKYPGSGSGEDTGNTRYLQCALLHAWWEILQTQKPPLARTTLKVNFLRRVVAVVVTWCVFLASSDISLVLSQSCSSTANMMIW